MVSARASTVAKQEESTIKLRQNERDIEERTPFDGAVKFMVANSELHG
jgi:hypothetical protein